MRAEDESRHDPEVAAAAAAAGPEQIRVVALVGDEDLPSAVTICTETRLSDASPQARDASPKPPPSAWPPMPTLGHVPAGIASPWRRDRRRRSRAGHPARRRLTARDGDARQLRQVDDDAAGHGRVAAVAVAARAGDDVHARLRRPLDGGGDIGGVERPNDRERMDVVVEAVEDQPRALVPRCAAREDRPAHSGPERLQPRVGGRGEPTGEGEGRADSDTAHEADACSSGAERTVASLLAERHSHVWAVAALAAVLPPWPDRQRRPLARPVRRRDRARPPAEVDRVRDRGHRRLARRRRARPARLLGELPRVRWAARSRSRRRSQRRSRSGRSRTG